MSRKCCVLACKGNYETGPKVSVPTFPNEDDLKSKWLRGICRSDFVPTKHSMPSSSERSAQILCSSGLNSTGFVGFSGLSTGVLNYVPATSQVVEDVDNAASVDGDFRMIMRKMTKRDPTTKLKAVQEFSDLCKKKDEESLKGALPFWPRLYNQLAVDHDRRVREATHKAHQELIKKVGRNLAPYLRNIMGAWLICQCDPYGPAASAAKSAFIESFPENKQSEALMYCKDEIFIYMKDNLFHQTPQTLSDPTSCTAEETESKYYRIIKSSFDGLTLFISSILSRDYGKIESFINEILHEAKFWKYAKNKEPMVQAAWYNLTVCLCEKMSVCITPHASKLCPLTLGCLSQSDPLVTSITWEAALYVLNIMDDCWKYVNVRKAVFPQLWAILRSGGQGNAVILFPKLLPLLSKIPESLTEDKILFYKEFFGNIKTSLTLEKVQKSPSEYNAIIEAFVECTQFILQRSCSLNNDIPLQHFIVLDQLLFLLETSIVEEKPHLATSCLYSKLKELLDYLQDQAIVNSSRKNFEEILTLFWDNFFIMCNTLMNGDILLQDKQLLRLAEFFCCLHCTKKTKQLKCKRKEVTFVEKKGNSENIDETIKPAVLPLSPESVAVNYHIVQPTQKLCTAVMKKFDTTKNLSYLRLLSEVIGTVASQDLFSLLLKSERSLLISGNDAPKEYFYQVIYPWICDIGDLNCDKKAYISCLVNIVIAVCSCTNFQTAEDILNNFTKMASHTPGCHVFNARMPAWHQNDATNLNMTLKKNSRAGSLSTFKLQQMLWDESSENSLLHFKPETNTVLECLIERAINLPYENALKKWLRGPDVGHTIAILSQELCQTTINNTINDSEYVNSIWKILHLCLTTSECSEPVIGIEYTSKVLEIFHQCLTCNKSNQETNKKQVVEFVCDLTISLFTSFKGCWQLPAAEELLLSLFLLSCDITESSEYILDKLIQSWQLGVKHLLKEKIYLFQENGFFFKAAEKIHQQILNQFCSLKSEEKASISILKLVNTMYLALQQEDDIESFHTNVSFFLSIIFPSQEEWEMLQNTMGGQYLTSAVITNKQVATVPESPAMSGSYPAATSKYCLTSLLVSKVLNSVIDLWKNSLEEEEENNYINGEKSHELILNQLPNLVLALTYCTYSNYEYKSTKMIAEKDEKLSLYQQLKSNLLSLVSLLDDNCYIRLVNTLGLLSQQKGNLWSLSFELIISFEHRETLIHKYLLELSNKIDFDNTCSLQTLKAIIPYLDLSQLKEVIINTTNLMLCSADLFSIPGGGSLLHILVSCLKGKEILSLIDVQDHIIIALEYLLGVKGTGENSFLLNCDLTSKEDGKLYFVANTMSLLETVVVQKPVIFETKHWDFLLCNLVGWIESCNTSRFSSSLFILRFHIQAFSLLSAVSDFMEYFHSVKNEGNFPRNLLEEWKDVFADSVYDICLPLYVKMAENNSNNKYLDVGEEAVLIKMTESLRHIPFENILKCEFSSVEFSSSENATDKVCLLVDHLTLLLTSGIRSVQLGVHFILIRLMPYFAAEIVSKEEKAEDDKRLLPVAFINHLQKTGPVVETMLSDFCIGDCCILEPYTDAYTYGRAYLLAWIELLEFFSSASSEERSEYASYLCDEGLLRTLLNSLFCLMPYNPSLPSEGLKKQKTVKTMFTERPSLHIDAVDTHLELQHIACHVYLVALRKLPALVRQWWTNQEKRTSEIVNNFTSSYVSSLICAKEIQSVHADDKKFTNMIIKARPSAREVVATYTIDEVTIELLIQLPSNHPLGPIVVESGRRIGVAQTQWRNWMLQLTTFLTHQNGSILEGLALWKRNVDKRFEGVEECMICFYVVHGSTCQLPRLSCRTCKKKFHSACLYKWFSTSNNSSCPLCRNLF